MDQNENTDILFNIKVSPYRLDGVMDEIGVTLAKDTWQTVRLRDNDERHTMHSYFLKHLSEGKYMLRNSELQTRCLESMVEFFSVYKIIHEQMMASTSARERFETPEVDRKKYEDVLEAINVYSLYPAAIVASKGLDDAPEVEGGLPDLMTDSDHRINLRKDRPDIYRQFTKTLIQGLDKYRDEIKAGRETEDRLVQLFQVFFQQTANSMLMLKDIHMRFYKDSNLLRPVEIKGTKFNGFDYLSGFLDHTRKRFTFADYGGNKEAKEELISIADAIKNPNVYESWGTKIPKGILLVGPPGTGKTLLAKCFAGEVDLPFHDYSFEDVASKYVDERPKKIAQMLNQLGVIFIDEFDSISKERGDSDTHEITEQSVNVINVALDGYDVKDYGETRLVIAATNRLNIIDRSLLRAGRFDRIITLTYPDKEAIREIWDIYERKSNEKADRKLFRRLSYRTLIDAMYERRFTGADIDEIIRRTTEKKARLEIKTGKRPTMINTEDILDEINAYERDHRADILVDMSRKLFSELEKLYPEQVTDELSENEQNIDNKNEKVSEEE